MKIKDIGASFQKFVIDKRMNVKLPAEGPKTILSEHETRPAYKKMNTETNIARWK